ncbi:MAG: hypothetical protein HC933_20040 [Pleurocapsa sp. SU_196_0]|nr:hypothetical protein [Pleurocapsa sp. SU_196_0]
MFRAANAQSGGQSNAVVYQLGDANYGFGMGNNAAEGFVVYRSGTAPSASFGHRFLVAGQEVFTLRGDPFERADEEGNRQRSDDGS